MAIAEQEEKSFLDKFRPGPPEGVVIPQGWEWIKTEGDEIWFRNQRDGTIKSGLISELEIQEGE